MNSQFLEGISNTEDGVNKCEKIWISSSEDAFSINAVIGLSSQRIYGLWQRLRLTT